MADAKLTALTATTTAASTDLVYVVVDPGGTPLSRKSTVANFARSAIPGIGVRVRDSALASATTTPTAVTWDTEDFDDAAFFDAGSNTRLTIPAGYGGLYLLTASVRPATGTGEYRVSIAARLDGTTSVDPSGTLVKSTTSSSLSGTLYITVPLRLSAAQYVELMLSANTTVDMLDTDNHFGLVRIGT